jgi:glycosyltransferase involved in cell wall biosynthesis
VKALMLTHTYHPSIGGGVRYKKAVVDHMRRRGHHVDVLAVSTDGSWSLVPSSRGTVMRVPLWKEVNSSAISPAYPFVFGGLVGKYDLLHFNFPSPMTELSLLAHRRSCRRIRKVVMYHADIVPAKRFSTAYNHLVTHSFLRQMDRIVVSSPTVAAKSPHLNGLADRISVIPFGVDPAAYAIENPPVKSGRNGGELSILFVGRLSRYKGVEHLMEAMTEAPGRLRIVGDGPLRQELAEQASRSSASDRISFLGRLSDEELSHEYHAADVLVLPSTDAGEAFGYVLVEGMMCGTALITTELGTGTSFVNVDGETGAVVPPREPSAIAAALAGMSDDRGLLRRYQDAAVERAHRRFHIDRMLRETEEIYFS